MEDNEVIFNTKECEIKGTFRAYFMRIVKKKYVDEKYVDKKNPNN